MPIVYQPAAPVGFAGGAGQAEAMERNLPTLAAAYGHAAQLAQQQAESGQRAQLANAARMQDDRQFQDRIIADRNAQGANLVAGAEHQQGVANMQAAGFLAEQQRQERGAQLHAWVNQQALSQKEKMELEQQKRAVGEVMASTSLTDENKQDLVLQLKTGIDAKEQRLKGEQMKALAEQRQMHAELYRSQVKENEQKDAYQAASLGNKFFYRVDPRAAQQIADEVADSAPGIDRNSPEFQQQVDRLAKERGAGHWYYPDKDGKPVLDKSSEIREQGQAKIAGDRAAAGAGKVPGQLSSEQVAHHAEMATKGTDEMAKARAAEGKPMSADEWGKEFERRFQIVNDAVAKQEAKLSGETAKGQAHAEAKAEHESLDKMVSDIGANQSILPLQRGYGLKLLGEAKNLLTKYKTLADMPPLVRRRYEFLGGEMKNLMQSQAGGPAAAAGQASIDAERVRQTVEGMRPKFQIDNRSRWEKFLAGELVTGQDVRDVFTGELGPPSSRPK